MVVHATDTPRRKSSTTSFTTRLSKTRTHLYEAHSSGHLPRRPPKQGLTPNPCNADIPISRISKGRNCEFPTITIARHPVYSALDRQTLLLTRASHFPDRTLPRPFSCPLPLGPKDEVEFKIGDPVRTRQFNAQKRTWSPWEQGVVFEYIEVQFLFGLRSRAYRVLCTTSSGSKDLTPRTFRPYLGEMVRLKEPDPTFDPNECAEVYFNMRRVYARVKDDRITTSSVKLSNIWMEALLDKWEDGMAPKVIVLAPLAKGQKFEATAVLPFSLDTAIACHAWGDYVSSTHEGDIVPPMDKEEWENMCLCDFRSSYITAGPNCIRASDPDAKL